MTLVPILGGVSAMLTPVLFGVSAAIPLFVGITGVVGGTMGLALRGLLGRERITRSILDELEAERMQANQRRLAGLRRKLEADGDPRTEQLLDDLLALTTTFRDDKSWLENVNAAVASDLLSGVDALFDGCLKNLEHSLELAATLRKLSNATAKASLQSDRERVITEIEASVAELSRYLSELRVLCRASAPEHELHRIRDDLDRSLKVAQQTALEAANWSAEGSPKRPPRAAKKEIPG